MRYPQDPSKKAASEGVPQTQPPPAASRPQQDPPCALAAASAIACEVDELRSRTRLLLFYFCSSARPTSSSSGDKFFKLN